MAVPDAQCDPAVMEPESGPCLHKQQGGFDPPNFELYFLSFMLCPLENWFSQEPNLPWVQRTRLFLDFVSLGVLWLLWVVDRTPNIVQGTGTSDVLSWGSFSVPLAVKTLSPRVKVCNRKSWKWRPRFLNYIVIDCKTFRLVFCIRYLISQQQKRSLYVWFAHLVDHLVKPFSKV